MINPEKLRGLRDRYRGDEIPTTYRKNAIRERERSSPGEREEANIERKTAGVTGIRLVLRGPVGASALVPGPGVALELVWAPDMESGYGRCDTTGGVETVGYAAAAYEAGVIVLVLGVDVGVRLEPVLERTDGDGELTIAEESILVSMMVLGRLVPAGAKPTCGSRADSYFRISGLSSCGASLTQYCSGQ